MRKLWHSMSNVGWNDFWQGSDGRSGIRKASWRWGLSGVCKDRWDLQMWRCWRRAFKAESACRENRHILFGELRHQASPKYGMELSYFVSLFKWNSVQKALSTLGSTSQILNAGAFLLCVNTFIWGPWRLLLLSHASNVAERFGEKAASAGCSSPDRGLPRWIWAGSTSLQ